MLYYVKQTFLKEKKCMKRVRCLPLLQRVWHFLSYSFKFQPNVCNRGHDLLMMSMYLSDMAILDI